MADTNHDGLVSQFAEITGASTERAQFFLESANWQLQVNRFEHSIKMMSSTNFVFIFSWLWQAFMRTLIQLMKETMLA